MQSLRDNHQNITYVGLLKAVRYVPYPISFRDQVLCPQPLLTDFLKGNLA
jgi:hypothetical protein